MWIRKDIFEIKQVKPKRKWEKVLLYFGIFIFFSLILMIAARIHGDNWNWPRMTDNNIPLSWIEVFTNSLAYLGTSLAITLILCYMIESGSKKTKKYICDKCDNVYENVKSDECKCGGKLVDLNLMKWVDDDKEINNE